jgi:hypothetical protein
MGAFFAHIAVGNVRLTLQNSRNLPMASLYWGLSRIPRPQAENASSIVVARSNGFRTTHFHFKVLEALRI